MTEDLMSAVADVLKANKAATPDSALEKYRKELTVDDGFLAYANPWVTASIDATSDTEVTHVKFFPLASHGYVILTAARHGEPGAVEFERSPSRRTGQFRLRIALLPFRLKIEDGHKVKFPASLEEIETEEGKRMVVLLRVKRPVSRKVAPRKGRGASPADQAAAGAMGPEEN